MSKDLRIVIVRLSPSDNDTRILMSFLAVLSNTNVDINYIESLDGNLHYMMEVTINGLSRYMGWGEDF